MVGGGGPGNKGSKDWYILKNTKGKRHRKGGFKHGNGAAAKSKLWSLRSSERGSYHQRGPRRNTLVRGFCGTGRGWGGVRQESSRDWIAS